jgi:dihydroneopterin aldolase
VVVEVRPAHGLGDDVDRILSYDRITEAIAAELDRERLNLLETLAERVAGRILAAPQALRTFVRIEKLDLGPGALGVEIVRTRDELPRELVPDAGDQPAPHVFYLGPEAMVSPRLKDWLGEIEARGIPAILCVARGEAERPEVPIELVQQRIDLLHLEQSAWILAARDRRCVVVDSRSELDWASRQGRISVWAPSKMVLDATTPPESETPDHLAVWPAKEFDAAGLVFVGADALEGSGANSLPANTKALLSGA